LMRSTKAWGNEFSCPNKIPIFFMVVRYVLIPVFPILVLAHGS
jgi:hypothetical protein